MKIKFWRLYFVLLTLIVLTGCSEGNSGTSNSEFMHDHFVAPFINIIHFFAKHFGGSYGLAIIAITMIIRFLLLPLMLKNYKSQKLMQQKMQNLKPEMDALQNKIKNTNNAEEKAQLQQEIFGLYKKHNVNPLNIGCLPLLIQTPILMALYYAIRGDQTLSSQSFLWFNLGTPDIVMTLIAGLLYYIQFKLSIKDMNETQQKQMRFMGLLSPIMITVFSFSSPAVLPLYWTIGALFLIIQQYIARNFIKIEILVQQKN
ncbi:membrane protein insertase YidC [Viridibacillus arvi]|uniref:membrane protein insertase YidC n=1 Tax=Viridibacillus arvi TaxID=263475 RepID=UPI001D10ADF6|nr:membrane protein insertase YidC [Viridibacillus sp. JNUCC-6]